jgi:hypothetical protein
MYLSFLGGGAHRPRRSHAAHRLRALDPVRKEGFQDWSAGVRAAAIPRSRDAAAERPVTLLVFVDRD